MVQVDSKKKIKVRGKVKDVLANTQFKVLVEIDGMEHELLAHLSGKMRMHYIKLQQGDEVDVLISQYDLNRGIIVYRH
jgi:translation initiation factor IF-1